MEEHQKHSGCEECIAHDSEFSPGKESGSKWESVNMLDFVMSYSLIKG